MVNKVLKKMKLFVGIIFLTTINACAYIGGGPIAAPTRGEDNVKNLILLKFKNEKMSDFRTIDQSYKKIAAYTLETIKFGIVSEKKITDAEVTWGGELEGTGLENSYLIMNSGTKIVSVRYKDTEVKVEILVNDIPSGEDDVAYAVSHPVGTAFAYLYNLVGNDVNTLAPFVWANEAYPGEQHNSKADAARHCCWAMLLARYIGVDYAEGLTYAHEVSESPGPATETAMDLYNNSVGVTNFNHEHGKDNVCCYNTVKNLVKDAGGTGFLLYLDSSHGVENSTEDALLQFTNK